MLKHYLKISFRGLVRDKNYTLLNLFGLAFGITCCLLFTSWVRYELSYEHCFKNQDRIYRVISNTKEEGDIKKSGRLPCALSDALKNDFPQVSASTYIITDNFLQPYTFGDNKINAYHTETNRDFFRVFPFEFVEGNPADPFNNDKAVVLSEDYARRLFGDKPAVGQVIGGTWNRKFNVTAVVRVPGNTHLKFDLLVLSEQSTHHGSDPGKSWDGMKSTALYVLLDNNADFTDEARLKMANIVEKYSDKEIKLSFQPISDIHLHTEFADHFTIEKGKGEMQYVVIFSILAVLILSIATLNYINLSTARSGNRAREVGVRKISGSTQLQLIHCFLSESFLLSILSMLLGIVLAVITLPAFGNMLGAKLSLGLDFGTLIIALLMCIFISVSAGAYAAFYLTSVKTTDVLKGGTSTGSKQVFRKIIVVVQFALSIFIMLCATVVHNQVQYIHNKDLGYDRKNVIVVSTGLWYEVETFKKEIQNNTNVQAVSIASSSPVNLSWYQDFDRWEGKTDDEKHKFGCIYADTDYPKVFGMKIVEGEIPADATVGNYFEGGETYKQPVIINETARKLMNYDQAVGKFFGEDQITTVIRDFHFRPLQNQVEPLVIYYSPETIEKLFIRINPVNASHTIKYVESVFKKMRPEYSFEWSYVDDEYNSMYRKEFRLGQLLIALSVVAMFVSCIGVLGLLSFMVERRAKEIAIRKINGASINDIMRLFMREFVILIGIATLIAVPVGLWFMSGWLNNYAYRVGISVFIVIGIIVFVFLITLITLSYRIYEAANRNPAEVIKSE